MNWMLSNLAESLLIIGLILLGVEIVVLGFSTFILFFVGIAALITAALLQLAFIPDNWQSALLSVAIVTSVLAMTLWSSLKKMQSRVDKTRAASDLIGFQFLLVDDVAPNKPSLHHYSGIAWKLRCKEPIKAGTWVEVVQADVGEFAIRPRYDL